jgi:uncharacterized protein (TIGR03067 family)
LGSQPSNVAAMNPYRRLLTIACLITALTANAAEQPAAEGKGAAGQSVAAELQPLQGTWEGVVVGDKSNAKISITVSGDSFHFHRDTNFWFETTIAVPAGTNPRQLHATIKDCPPSQNSSLGKVVVAIFKIENGALTLATGNPEPLPKSFDAAENEGMSLYELRKVQAQKEIIPPLKIK